MGSNSSKWPFIIVSILISAILVTSAFIYYQSKTKEIREEKNQTLAAINHLKLDQLVQWRVERIGQANFFPTMGQFIRYTDWLTKNRNNKEAYDFFFNLFEPLKENHNFENVFICGKDGKLLFSLDEDFGKIDSITIEDIKASINGDSLVFGDLYYNINKNKICLDITTPVRNNDGKVIGSFTQIIYPDRY